MQKLKFLNQLVTILLLLNFLTASATIEEYKIEGKFINYEAIDLQGIKIKASIVTPSGHLIKDIAINGKGEFYIVGKCFKELNQIWLSIGDLYYGEILISTYLSIVVDVHQLSKLNVNFYGPGIQFEGIDAEATILANKWINYHRDEKLMLNSKIQEVSYLHNTESEKIDSLTRLFKKLEQIEINFINENPSSSSWILEDKRYSEYFNQLFSICDKDDIDWTNLDRALKYTPKILGNSGWLFYRYGSFILSEAYIGSNILQNWEKQEKNLEKLDSTNQDFLILSGIPDDLQWQKGYLIKFLPLVNEEWTRKYIQEALIINKNSR
ncbi:hypothetical protein [Portibacter marinus]|uniref:hypothetical protein n=1 Tax=Portibacter marinus TaxID=2898660 RepID=UPI001F3192C8|nr:hypothetical protein [Portibacter marinus]